MSECKRYGEMTQEEQKNDVEIRQKSREVYEEKFHRHILNMRERFGILPRIFVGGDQSGNRHINWVIAAFAEIYNKENYETFMSDPNPLVRIFAERLFNSKIPFLGRPAIDENYNCLWLDAEDLAYRNYLEYSERPSKQQYLCLFYTAYTDEVSKVKALGKYAFKHPEKFSELYPLSVMVSLEIDDFSHEQWEEAILGELKKYDEKATVYEVRNNASIHPEVIVGFVSAYDFYRLRREAVCKEAKVVAFETIENGHV